MSTRSSLRFIGLLLAVLVGLSCRAYGADAAPAPPAAPPAASTVSAADAQKALEVQKIVLDAAARVRASQADRSLAAAYAGQLAQTADFTAATEQSVQRLEALAAPAQEVADKNLIAALDGDIAGLNSLQDSTRLGGQPAPKPGSTDDLNAALAAAQTQKAAVAQALIEVQKAKQDLTDARDHLITSVGTLFGTWDARLSPLKDTAHDAAAPILLTTLPSHLPDLVVTEGVLDRLNHGWEAVKQQVSRPEWQSQSPAPAAGVVGPADAAQAKADGLGKDIGAVALLLPDWLITLQKHVQGLSATAVLLQPKLIADPVGNTAEARQAAADDGRTAEVLMQIRGAGADFLGEIRNSPGFAGQVPTLDASLASLAKAGQDFQTSLNGLREALGGARSDWVADQVSLFYFDDVRRLMLVLNPNAQEKGGTAGLQEKGAAARADLSRAEMDLSDAQAKVNTLQHRLGGMKETLRQAQAKRDAAGATAQIFGRRLTDAKRLQTQEQTKLTRADGALQTDPNNSLKKAALESAQRAKDNADQDVTSADDRSTDAAGDQDKAQQALDDLKNENDSLPTAITQAQGQLETAQQAVILNRRLALSAAQDVTEAFAASRDNAPYLEADAEAASSDPARRVEMYAFNDSKTIFLRGKREDVAAVKTLIAQFDKPTPQARLTLWTLELDTAADKTGTERFNKALLLVEKLLSEKRTQIAASLSLLRDVINQEVNDVSSKTDAEYRPKGFQRFLGPDNPYESRLKIYSADFFGENRRLMRASGFDLPEPAGTTTLGEALMVLSMANHDSKKRILDGFDKRLTQEAERNSPRQRMFGGLAEYRKENNLPDPPQPPAPPPGFPDTVWFASLRRALGDSLDGIVPAGDPCPAQMELLRAFKRKAWARIADKLQNQSRSLQDIGSSVRRLDAEIKDLTAQRKSVEEKAAQDEKSLGKKNNPPKNATRIQDIRTQRDVSVRGVVSQQEGKALEIQQLWDERDDIIDSQFVPLFNNLPPSTRIRRFTDKFLARDKTPEAVFGNAAAALAASDDVREQYGTDEANARVAAADQMLKEMIVAMEDDLDRYFVSPMLNNLRQDLLKGGIQVGVLNRTSLLASNRLVARVDPRGTGQVAVGEEENSLRDAQQLASLVLATQTAGLSGVAGLEGALGGLNALPRDAPDALYGVTTGTVFQVTPVIDPSGQALRFRFDYTAATQVREPNGSLSPQLPRIERHAVNTEVQLSNMELRNISQYDGNVKLGITPHKEGGIPILKDIPLLSDLPIVGWFSRRTGQAAVTQQSLIFAQTTIYPTINDIIGLLAGDYLAGDYLPERDADTSRAAAVRPAVSETNH